MSDPEQPGSDRGLPECGDCNRLIQVPSDHETFCPSEGAVVE